MKVFGKWLVKGEHGRIASSYMTKQDAIHELDYLFTRKGENLWEDTLGEQYHIVKNTREYK